MAGWRVSHQGDAAGAAGEGVSQDADNQHRVVRTVDVIICVRPHMIV